MAVSTDLSPCSRSVLFTFTVRVTKRRPVNISFLKTSAAHYRGTICLAVRVCVAPSWFNSYAPELVRISRISLKFQLIYLVFSFIFLLHITFISQKILSDLRETWKEIAYMCLGSVGVSLIMVVLMRYLAGLFVWIVVLMIIAISTGATGYCW